MEFLSICLERKVGLVLVAACASFFALVLHWSYRSSPGLLCDCLSEICTKKQWFYKELWISPSRWCTKWLERKALTWTHSRSQWNIFSLQLVTTTKRRTEFETNFHLSKKKLAVQKSTKLVAAKKSQPTKIKKTAGLMADIAFPNGCHAILHLNNAWSLGFQKFHLVRVHWNQARGDRGRLGGEVASIGDVWETGKIRIAVRNQFMFCIACMCNLYHEIMIWWYGWSTLNHMQDCMWRFNSTHL